MAYAKILQFNDFRQSSNACIADRLNMDGEDQKDLSQPNMRFEGAPTQVCIQPKSLVIGR